MQSAPRIQFITMTNFYALFSHLSVIMIIIPFRWVITNNVWSFVYGSQPGHQHRNLRSGQESARTRLIISFKIEKTSKRRGTSQSQSTAAGLLIYWRFCYELNRFDFIIKGLINIWIEILSSARLSTESLQSILCRSTWYLTSFLVSMSCALSSCFNPDKEIN